MHPLPFLLMCMAGLLVPAQAQVPPREAPPPYVVAARLEAELKAEIAAEGLTVARAMTLATLQEKRGAPAEAEATLLDARKLFPENERLVSMLVGLYSRQGKAAASVAVMEELAALSPTNPARHYTVATYYEEIVRKGFNLSDGDKRTYVLKGIAATDRALALDPMYGDAMAYKNILLRHQMRLETDPARQRILESEANALRTHAMELAKQRAPRASTVPSPSAPPPPPPPPAAPCRPATEVFGQAPVRVGGNIRAPTKTRDVRPVYPPAAHVERIQGVVIIEAYVDSDGRVAQACVLRSIPLLDQAAIDAVAQWEFTPTLLNGLPVPVVMTVTVNFTLQ